MLMWMGVYVGVVSIVLGPISPAQWHAHQMIYGYCMAVIAGFLLTAVENWTGAKTLQGRLLAALAVLWVFARAAFFFGPAGFLLAAFADVLFMVALSIAVARPIILTRQWRQLGILSKLILLLAGNVAFYTGLFGLDSATVNLSLFGGLYLVIGLILAIIGRVLPGYIRNALSEPEPPRNPAMLAGLSLALFLAFFVNQLFIGDQSILFITSVSLAVVTTARLWLWHRPGIWRRPLLWSMFVSLAFIDMGFLLYAASVGDSRLVLFATHALAAGGVGLITLSMMARVTLGHTGRSIQRTSPLLVISFALLIGAASVRVFGPLLRMEHYQVWIVLAQGGWVLAFALFLLIHVRMLLGPAVSR